MPQRCDHDHAARLRARTEKGATSQVVAAVGRTAKASGAYAVIGLRLELSDQVVYGYGTAVTTDAGAAESSSTG